MMPKITISRAVPPRTPPKIAPKCLAELLHSVAERQLGHPSGQSKERVKHTIFEKSLYRGKH